MTALQNSPLQKIPPVNMERWRTTISDWELAQQNIFKHSA